MKKLILIALVFCLPLFAFSQMSRSRMVTMNGNNYPCSIRYHDTGNQVTLCITQYNKISFPNAFSNFEIYVTLNASDGNIPEGSFSSNEDWGMVYHYAGWHSAYQYYKSTKAQITIEKEEGEYNPYNLSGYMTFDNPAMDSVLFTYRGYVEEEPLEVSSITSIDGNLYKNSVGSITLPNGTKADTNYGFSVKDNDSLYIYIADKNMLWEMDMQHGIRLKMPLQEDIPTGTWQYEAEKMVTFIPAFFDENETEYPTHTSLTIQSVGKDYGIKYSMTFADGKKLTGNYTGAIHQREPMYAKEPDSYYIEPYDFELDEPYNSDQDYAMLQMTNLVDEVGEYFEKNPDAMWFNSDDYKALFPDMTFDHPQATRVELQTNETYNSTMVIGKLLFTNDVYALVYDENETYLQFYKLMDGEWLKKGELYAETNLFFLDIKELNGDNSYPELILSSTPNMNGNQFSHIFCYNEEEDTIEYQDVITGNYTAYAEKKRLEEIYEGSAYMPMWKTLYEWIGIRLYIKRHVLISGEEEDVQYLRFYENPDKHLDSGANKVEPVLEEVLNYKSKNYKKYWEDFFKLK